MLLQRRLCSRRHAGNSLNVVGSLPLHLADIVFLRFVKTLTSALRWETSAPLDVTTYLARSVAFALTDFLWHLTVGTAKVRFFTHLLLSPLINHCAADVDECNTPANNCKFQCKNLIGSFMCLCPEGYTQVGHSDDCRDINECALNPGLCQNGHCVNLQGSYRCDCFEGFEPSYDRRHCIGE